jgi:uncharacterized FlaG/YvyC family protein
VKKLTLLIAAGAGYVLGTRAGRERYEQIKTQSSKVWNNPKVQETVSDVQAQAKQAGADVSHKVGDKVSEAAGDVKAKVVDRDQSTDEPYRSTPSGPTSL